MTKTENTSSLEEAYKTILARDTHYSTIATNYFLNLNPLLKIEYGRMILGVIKYDLSLPSKRQQIIIKPVNVTLLELINTLRVFNFRNNEILDNALDKTTKMLEKIGKFIMKHQRAISVSNDIENVVSPPDSLVDYYLSK